MLSAFEPRREDLWFRRLMLSDEETMSYNRAWGGVIDFPEEDWEGWYERWIARPGGKRYYRYLREDSGSFVGEIAYHHDADADRCLADVIIYAPFRGKGYGKRGLAMLCAAAKENGFAALYDDIAADNPAIALFLKQGFTEEYRTEEKIFLKKEL
ncbi:MAG: GNAT family N-acetyltransferase [Oscillospiraceae bacterium]|nr:GNAT family N-acetyltransferase [Oscillospiraceae bacterium]